MRTKPTIPILASDRAFIQQLYEEYKNLMLYTAAKYTDDPRDREDIVQEALCRLMKNISALRCVPCCNLKRYIVLTIRAVFLDMQKKRDAAVLPLEDEMLEKVLCRELLREDGISKLSAKLDVLQLKRELPARDWVLLEGKYIQELPDTLLGQLVGVSAGSVRMLLSRARKQAREILLGSAEKGGGTDE